MGQGHCHRAMTRAATGAWTGDEHVRRPLVLAKPPALTSGAHLRPQAGGEGVDLLACCQVDVILCAASVDPRSDAAAPGSHSWSPEDRVVEHVQSISTWAPACIGPYSQATALGECRLRAAVRANSVW